MSTATPDMFEFVGGPYDGRQMEVVIPPPPDSELVVHAVGKGEPAEFYLFGQDGKFHHVNVPSQHRSPDW